MDFKNWKRWLINVLLILAIYLVVTAWQGRNLISNKHLLHHFGFLLFPDHLLRWKICVDAGCCFTFLHRGAKFVISASAISTGLGISGMKNLSRSSLLPFPTRSYRVSKPFWSAMLSVFPCCSELGSYSTPIESAPFPPSMYLMNLGTSMAPQSATLVPLASGGVHYEPNESPS